MQNQQGKLYRSNINCNSVGMNLQAQQKMIQDYERQFQNRKQNYSKKILIHSTSHPNQKRVDVISLVGGSNQTIPSFMTNDVRKSCFLGIGDAYLNLGFKKQGQPSQNKLLYNSTQLQRDTESFGSRSNKKYQGANQFYKYWKGKAHQYLQQNFKLKQQNKNLKKEIQTLHENVERDKKQRVNLENSADVQVRVREQKSFSQLQNIFKNKFNELQCEIKQKSRKTLNLQDKVLEMNRKILGEQQRSQLITRLGQQVDCLSRQNISLKKQTFQVQPGQTQKWQLQLQLNTPTKKHSPTKRTIPTGKGLSVSTKKGD